MKLIIVPVTAGILTLTMIAPLIIKDCILGCLGEWVEEKKSLKA